VIASRAGAFVADCRLYEPTLEDYGRRAATFPGLGFTNGWLTAGLSTASGQRFAVMREHEVGTTCVYYGFELTRDVWSWPLVRQMAAPGVDPLYTGPIHYEPAGATHEIRGMNPAFPRFAISLAPATIHWIEGEWLDLTLTSLGSSLQRRVAGGPDDYAFMSALYRATGVVDGMSVTGFGGYDRSYHDHGVTWRQSSAFRFEHLWWWWAGVHDDGRRERGWAVAGRDPGFGVGAFHRDGEDPVVATTLDHDVTWQERNGRRQPVGALLRFDGRTFRYVSTGNVSVPAADTSMGWMHGDVTEEGADHPAERFCWLHFIKGGA